MALIDNFSELKVLIVGDLMLDRYWWGDVNRISPEAPVPVVRLRQRTVAPGGAANVAANIAGLGSEALLVGAVGADPEGRELRDCLKQSGVSDAYLIEIADRPTNVKTRIVAHNQQVVRVDQETTSTIDGPSVSATFEKISELLPVADIVVVSDYAKGFLRSDTISWLMDTATSIGKRVIVDPKGRDFGKYKGATMLTPNRREAVEACNLDEESDGVVELAGTRLLQELSLEAVLITQSEKGMSLFETGKRSVHLPSAGHEVFDVTGAGDTVVATLAVSLAAGESFVSAAKLANLAASVVIEHLGTTAITSEQLADVLRSNAAALSVS